MADDFDIDSIPDMDTSEIEEVGIDDIPEVDTSGMAEEEYTPVLEDVIGGAAGALGEVGKSAQYYDQELSDVGYGVGDMYDVTKYILGRAGDALGYANQKIKDYMAESAGVEYDEEKGATSAQALQYLYGSEDKPTATGDFMRRLTDKIAEETYDMELGSKSGYKNYNKLLKDTMKNVSEFGIELLDPTALIPGSVAAKFGRGAAKLPLIRHGIEKTKEGARSVVLAAAGLKKADREFATNNIDSILKARPLDSVAEEAAIVAIKKNEEMNAFAESAYGLVSSNKPVPVGNVYVAMNDELKDIMKTVPDKRSVQEFRDSYDQFREASVLRRLEKRVQYAEGTNDIDLKRATLVLAEDLASGKRNVNEVSGLLEYGDMDSIIQFDHMMDDMPEVEVAKLKKGLRKKARALRKEGVVDDRVTIGIDNIANEYEHALKNRPPTPEFDANGVEIPDTLNGPEHVALMRASSPFYKSREKVDTLFTDTSDPVKIYNDLGKAFTKTDKEIGSTEFFRSSREIDSKLREFDSMYGTNLANEAKYAAFNKFINDSYKRRSALKPFKFKNVMKGALPAVAISAVAGKTGAALVGAAGAGLAGLEVIRGIGYKYGPMVAKRYLEASLEPANGKLWNRLIRVPAITNIMVEQVMDPGSDFSTLGAFRVDDPSALGHIEASITSDPDIDAVDKVNALAQIKEDGAFVMQLDLGDEPARQEKNNIEQLHKNAIGG